MKRQYGLIGYPLGHSFSADYFARKFAEEGITDAEYKAYPLHSVRPIRSVVRANDLLGFSVTIPHKEDIIPYLDELSDTAAAVGAVNMVKVLQRGGKMRLKGYNTDMPAFLETLIPLVDIKDLKALVLGSGGASKAICHALDKINIPYLIVSRVEGRAGCIHYDALSADMMKKHKLIINTTPLGMFPKAETFPAIPYQALSADHFLYDLVYNPEETVFLKKGRTAGAKTMNGMQMLRLQADYAWKIWCESA